MRQRNIKHLDEKIAEVSKYLLDNPEELKGRWRETFGFPGSLELEIGCGKGQFIARKASDNPDNMYVAVEGQLNVLLRGLQKADAGNLGNVAFFCRYIDSLNDFFEKGELDRIYLNFSDPWPKDRHAKRRLPSKEFLARYDRFLKKDGVLEFKTDNRGLFDFAVEELPQAGWKLVKITYDLHHDEEMMQGNVMTEYEQKFSSMGNPIYKYIINR